MIEQAVQKILTDEAAVSKRVGGKIYPQVARPNAKRPYITFSRVTGTHYRNSTGLAGLAMATVQIDVWADQYWSAKTIAEKTRLALDNFSGTVGTFTIAGIFLESEQDLHTPPFDGGSRGVHRSSMDFDVWFNEDTS